MSKNTPIKWHTANIKLSELKEYPDNPRKITKEMLDKLVAHIKEDGYHQRIIVDKRLYYYRRPSAEKSFVYGRF
jgi:hypothetical protein